MMRDLRTDGAVIDARDARDAVRPASDAGAAREDHAGNAASRGYRTLWRWHFYAALFVMPLLVVLAITGTLYCFQPQLEPLLYPHRLTVAPQARAKLPEDVLLAKAATALPASATASSAHITDDPTRSAEFVFRLPGGERESVYVNPYSGAVLGTLSVEHRFMQVDRMLHRKLLLGKPGELLMELAACWTLVMIGTGVALWWPRGRAQLRQSLWPRVALRGRPFWRSVHAVLGIWLAVGALAFVLTGLPWTGSWGRHFKSLATSAQLGAPPGAWGGLPLESRVQRAANTTDTAATLRPAGHHAVLMESMPGMTMDDLPVSNVPWAVGAVPVPHAASASSADAMASRLPLGQLVDTLRHLGLTGGYEIVFPRDAEGVYVVTYFPPDPTRERTLYIDQYSSQVLKDIRYSDYGAVAKAVSYGTSLHMGRYFGLANQLLCALISLGLAALVVTGCAMWWQRRPSMATGLRGLPRAPSPERGRPPMRAWRTALVLLGVVFPSMGASLVVVWLADRALCASSRRLTA